MILPSLPQLSYLSLVCICMFACCPQHKEQCFLFFVFCFFSTWDVWLTGYQPTSLVLTFVTFWLGLWLVSNLLLLHLTEHTHTHTHTHTHRIHIPEGGGVHWVFTQCLCHWTYILQKCLLFPWLDSTYLSPRTPWHCALLRLHLIKVFLWFLGKVLFIHFSPQKNYLFSLSSQGEEQSLSSPATSAPLPFG